MSMKIGYRIRKTTIVFFALGLILFSGATNDVFAIIYYNGAPTVLEDVIIDQDFFAGADVTAGGVSDLPSTSLTVRIRNWPLNILQNGSTIYGGSNIDNRGTGNINGDIQLNIFNLSAVGIPRQASIVGGNFVTNGNGHISGNVNTHLNNVSIINGDIVLGSVTQVLNGVDQIDGSINALIENSIFLGTSDILDSVNNCLVGGDVNLTLINTAVEGSVKLGNGDAYPYSVIEGNINLIIRNSMIREVIALESTRVNKNVYVNITDNSMIENLTLIRNGELPNGQLVLTVDGASYINEIDCGPADRNEVKLMSLNFNNCSINRLNGTPSLAGAVIENLIINANDDSYINELNLGTDSGEILQATINTYAGSSIGDIIIGDENNRNAFIEDVTINIYGGHINYITQSHSGYTNIIFHPGDVSSLSAILTNSTNLEFVNKVYVTKGAWTKFGIANTITNIDAKNIMLAGNVTIPPNATIFMNIQESFVADGGTIFPEHAPAHGRDPLVIFETLQTVQGQTPRLIIQNPLNVNLSLSPHLIGQGPVVFAEAGDNIFTPNLFSEHNTTGLLWNDVVYNDQEKKWYLQNIRASEDYYAYSSVREASSWLRGIHLSEVLSRIRGTMQDHTPGIWINLQAGKERLNPAVGTSKMPWFMANIGYDGLNSNIKDIKTLYGFSFGASKGKHKWQSVNMSKNDIVMGVFDLYGSLIHNSGLYGSLAAQYSFARIKTENNGFKSNKKWNETIPSGSVEFGWQHTLTNGFKFNPRAQIIGEYLSSEEFELSAEAGKDTAILKKSFIVTTILGLTGGYDFQIESMPLGVTASVDWIKGVKGEFTSHSKALNLSFKDKNNASTIRSSLELSTQLDEFISFKLKGFIDTGDDQGFGGQFVATYAF